MSFLNDETTLTLKNQKRKEAKEWIANRPHAWSDSNIRLLLDELKIEIGEGTNRFLYENEYEAYCQQIAHVFPATPDEIYDQIIWLWSTWEAISKATGISWWSISEEDKYRLSLLRDNKDQLLKEQFKYFDDCDRVFSYINKHECDDYLNSEDSIYY